MVINYPFWRMDTFESDKGIYIHTLFLTDSYIFKYLEQ